MLTLHILLARINLNLL